MTYEEIVKKVTQAVCKKDITVKEHVAVEIDIVGEGEGALYVELEEGKTIVEPYEYYDNDCKIHTDSDTLMELVNGKIDVIDALEEGKIHIHGDIEKALILSDVLKTAAHKKSSTI